MNITKLKKEHKLTLFDLITSSAPSEVTVSEKFQQKQQLQQLQVQQNSMNSNQYVMEKSIIYEQYNQVHNPQFDYSLSMNSNNMASNENYKIQNDFIQLQNHPDLILNQAINFDDLLTSPIRHEQNDPLLSHSNNIYDDSYMDSMN